MYIRLLVSNLLVSNLFVLSFPVKIGLTLLLVGIAIPQISPMLAGLTDASVDAMRGIAGG